jgi:uncharacterized membrane protein
MRHLLLFAHLLGMVLWMGGGLSAMSLGIAMRSARREELPVMLGVIGRIHRGLTFPGVLLGVISGLLLTLRLYGTAMSSNGYPVALMLMQVTGLLSAGILLGVTMPTAARLSRLDPDGPEAPLFNALRTKARIAGALAGLLAMVALVTGTLLR